IDHPATQKVKRALLARMGLKEPEDLHFIAMDFTQESLSSVLEKSVYNPKCPSLFSWLGVTHYLPLEAVRATLRSIAGLSCSGSEIVFDYWDKLAFDPTKSSNRMKSIIETTRKMGEPIITGFEPSELDAQLSRLQFSLIENLGPSEIRERYLQRCGGNYSTSEHVHLACAKVK
ncbi:MAG: class I SAM-dependent methyltransferase, partial [Syntrophomonadaceae bacterium]|nr:class I SAM-dependent methyltransferase [Syntrophomonadaceae bacterium]